MPRNLHASSATSASVSFAWEASTDNVRVVGYDVHVGSSPRRIKASGLSYTVTGLACGTSVSVKVTAYDRAGNRSAAATAAGSTTACAPAPPPPPPPPASGGEPGPIAGQGYSKVWGDEFDTLSSTAWGAGIWYDTGAPTNSIFVQNGILNLVSRRSQGYPDVTVTTEGGTNPVTFRRGYFESRMKWTKGNGAWPAFWLLSYRHAVNPAWPSINPVCQQVGEPVSHCYSAELDIFEGQGSEPNVFYGTVHRSSSNDYGIRNQQNSNNYHPLNIDLTADYHVYGMLWTATEIRWYLDGQLLHQAPVYDSTDQPMFLLLQMWTGGWTRGIDASTPDELKTEVDWVRVWQK